VRIRERDDQRVKLDTWNGKKNIARNNTKRKYRVKQEGSREKKNKVRRGKKGRKKI
jgi:hypothetical protein